MLNSITTYTYHSPCGDILLGSHNSSLCLCDWKYRKTRSTIDKRIQHALKAEYCEGITPVIESASHQLDRYFSGEICRFDVPLLFVGTEFQQRVWTELRHIPYAATISYLQLAELLGIPKAVRAVANANGANAISIFVPCHRVIGASGKLTGYAGGFNAKQFLINLECSHKDHFDVMHQLNR
ncbi:MAG: methylated-DNA--[protein]-cysteine S-methyltransferase [Bacteroidaceae bacterium]|nr:methylated-DNA--[protein]-cysteine S-methyltransferase [Bacteroidaceae bacterium]